MPVPILFAWIKANPGRINSIHCRTGRGEGKGYKVLFGEGDSRGPRYSRRPNRLRVEYYLIEQEGSRFPSLETADAVCHLEKNEGLKTLGRTRLAA